MKAVQKNVLYILMSVLLVFGCGEAVFAETQQPAAEARNDIADMVTAAREAFYRDQALKDELASEIVRKVEVVPAIEYGNEEREFYVLTHDGLSMKFFMETIGEPDQDGRYPLYLTLHGGGEGPEEENNDQWIDMFAYYKDAVENGIYIPCRGISDTWDLHFQEGSYPLYDRLIEAMTVCYGADPDRVYLLGFSAGGDGVYQIAPRMADRFAAVNMSSGHPNGVSLQNLFHCPISLQVGIRDYYSEDAERSVQAARFEQILSDYQKEYGSGYEHRVYVHVPAGHNYDDNGSSISQVLVDPTAFTKDNVPDDMLDAFLHVLEDCSYGDDVSTLSYFPMGQLEEFDNGITEVVTQQFALETTDVDANAVRYVSQFTRDPAPDQLVWDLGTRAASRTVDGFYWLEADPSVNQGFIKASADSENNTLTVEPSEDVSGDFTILFDPRLVDASRPVTVNTPKGSFTLTLSPSVDFLKETMIRRGDPQMLAVGSIRYSELQ